MSGAVKLNSSGGGSVTLTTPSTASNLTVTLPSASGTLATTSGTGSVFTNPTINGFTGDTSAITVGTNQFVKDTSGNVGIGTSSPAQTLHVKTATGGTPITLGVLSNATGLPALSFNGAYASTTMAGIYGNGASASNLYYTVPASQNHYFAVADSTKMTLDSSGNLGIGTSSPGTRLHVEVSGAASVITNKGTSANYYGYAGSTLVTQLQSASTQTFLNSVANVPLVFGTNDTERMRLDSSGNLGLGVTPSGWGSNRKPLQMGAGSFVAGRSDNATITYLGANFYYNGTSNIYLTSGVATLYAQDTGGHYWYNAPSGTAGNAISFTQAMTLFASGSLAIGSSSETSGVFLKVNGGGLYVTAPTSNTNGTNTLADNGSSPNNLRLYNNTDSNNTTNRFLICDTGASVLKAEIRSNGGLANYSANNVNLSDERVKTEITPAPSWLAKINAIEVVNFKYKDQTHDDFNLGAIAQQVQSVAPELVDTDGFGETPEDGIPLMAIYETDLKYAMLKAIQELHAELQELKSTLH